MSTAQLVFTEDELLQSHPFAAPLVAGEVRCHGGFDEAGNYVSPRTKNRQPAIAAWQEQHHDQFGTDLLHLPLDTWPETYPNVAQGQFLVRSGVPEPVISSLTRIGTVEGFGAMIRYSVLPDFRACFDEDTTGTAIEHLGRGLYEAHARDEAGFEDEGGHKQMWFAARDIAFEHPATEDETQRMLGRMGIATPGRGGAVDVSAMRRKAMTNRLLPEDISFDLESLIERMVRLLLIEISAFHTFAWAEALLSDTDLVAGDGEAARLVSYIRADETPHVEYLRTVLSEMRDRTFVGENGERHAGSDMVGRLWDRALGESLGSRRNDQLELTWGEVSHAVADRADGSDLLAQFGALGSMHRTADGTWLEVAPAA